MSALPGSVIAVDAIATLFLVGGLVLAFAPGRRGVPRDKDPGRTARLIFGTMIAAFSASIIILFTIFALDAPTR